MRILILVLFLTAFTVFSQEEIAGDWQGIYWANGKQMENGNVLLLNLTANSGGNDGYSREEIYNKKDFSIKQLKVKEGETISIEQTKPKKSSKSLLEPKCYLKFTLKYNENTGYLEGSYLSTDCRRTVGNVILFKSNSVLSMSDSMTVTHSWVKPFIAGYKKGWSAPQKRMEERNNFKFQPIYFDHDESIIKDEFKSYLNQMAKVVDGHSDLRIKITGHTDAVGTDNYNIGLSERRATAIVEYFKSVGIREDKLDIDFKGEKNPVDTNNTAEGKQRNRRVDFKFV